ncbi:Rac GTPase-activating protein 1 [Strongyloides ratti]|uniref:Rac GTPase-activating protein 1 n=1 Tax=Strongyloides ratti TaxID=34506 RepID=A0A090KTY0_STRRB|nr:Rac GTPase-activating protein 1 [Strongyloides ratti]CEF60980.1 Rac GTPase-activating protein 1 [Strongyloides ratti]
MDTVETLRFFVTLSSTDNTIEGINYLIDELSNAHKLLVKQNEDKISLHDFIYKLKEENEILKDENKKLKDKIDEIERSNIMLGKLVNNSNNGENEVLKNENKKLKEKIKQLEISNKICDKINFKENDMIDVEGTQSLKRSTSIASIMITKIAPEIPVTPHCFEIITNLISESCDVCKKSITFVKTKLRCSGCLVIVHEKCLYQVENDPCFMRKKKDCKENESKNERHRISYFCPEITDDFNGYCVPHIIQNCIHYLNENCLINSADLYNKSKVTSQEKSTSKELLKSFHQRRLPNLSRYSPKCIAYTVLLFLSELSETLIPPSSYKEFIYFITKDDLLKAIKDLPLPNRHSLTLLILHWKKYIKRSLSPISTRDELTRELWQILLSSGRSSITNGIINEEVLGKKVVKSLLTDITSESLIKILKEKGDDQKIFTPILRIQTKEKKIPRLSLVKRQISTTPRQSEKYETPKSFRDRKSLLRKSPWR